MKVFSILLLVLTLILTSISAVASNESEIIQARKDLTSMGLVYNDKAAFINSLKNRDKIAFKLFIKAGGVDVGSIFSDRGRGAFWWARGDAEIVKLIADLFLKEVSLSGQNSLETVGVKHFIGQRKMVI